MRLISEIVQQHSNYTLVRQHEFAMKCLKEEGEGAMRDFYRDCARMYWLEIERRGSGYDTN